MEEDRQIRTSKKTKTLSRERDISHKIQNTLKEIYMLILS
nr:MAG TPA: hypothetical protein [Caudoviricetes sp.]